MSFDDELKDIRKRAGISESPKPKKVKVWNGTEALRGSREYLSVYVGAHSVKHALELLDQAGFSYMGPTHLKNYFSPTWGRPMDGIEPQVGVWVTPSSGPAGTPKKLV